MLNIIKAKRFRALDTLRTILALIVASGHFYHWNYVHHRMPSSFFLAVDFFFVLSGFVLSQSVLVDDSSNNIDNFLKKFCFRRFLRLFPVYWLLFLITVIILLIKFKNPGGSLYDYVISFLLLQAIGLYHRDICKHCILDSSTPGIAWSISAEFWLDIPFFIFVYKMRKHPITSTIFCIFLAIICLIIITSNSPNFMDVHFVKIYGNLTGAVLRCTLGLCMGYIGFQVYQIINKINLPSIWFVFSEIMVILLVLYTYCEINYNRDNDFVVPVISMVIIILFAVEKGCIFRILLWQKLNLFRQLSYAIYLVHPLILFIYNDFNISFRSPYIFYYLLIVLTTSYLLHRYVERPFIRNVLS